MNTYATHLYRASYGVAAVLFTLFLANVLAGRMTGAVWLDDVGEAIVLFIAVVAFSAGILVSEARNPSKEG